MGIISLLDRVTSWLPIQKKKERIRNRIDKLEKERREILKRRPTNKLANRVANISNELARLRQKLKNI